MAINDRTDAWTAIVDRAQDDTRPEALRIEKEKLAKAQELGAKHLEFRTRQADLALDSAHLSEEAGFFMLSTAGKLARAIIEAFPTARLWYELKDETGRLLKENGQPIRAYEDDSSVPWRIKKRGNNKPVSRVVAAADEVLRSANCPLSAVELQRTKALNLGRSKARDALTDAYQFLTGAKPDMDPVPE